MVAIIRCTGYTDYPAVKQAVTECFAACGGITTLVSPGQQVLLKPNLLAVSAPDAGVNTHPSIVRAVAELVLEAGGLPFLGDSPAFARLETVCEACGITAVAHDLGIPIHSFTDPVWIPCRVTGSPARGYFIDRAVRDAPVRINLPKLKAHRQLGFSGAAKNLYGCMPGKRKAWQHAHYPRDPLFAAYQAGLAATVLPVFTVVDAIVAMHRDGPKGGDLLPMGLLLAGSDPFAVDSLTAQLIRIPPENDLIGAAAHRLGLGVTDPEQITVRGVDPRTLPAIPFRHPLLVGTSFSLPRLARSIWRSFLINHLGRPEKL